jgi:hypothetical protein
MKFPIDKEVYAIFGGKVHVSRVRSQSRQYKEFMRLHIFDNMKVINGHDVPMIIDLHPDDVYEDKVAAQKVLFERKLKGLPENTEYELED